MFHWFFASGDLEFFWKEQIASVSWLPQGYRPEIGYGLNTILTLWLDYPFRVVLKLLSTLGLSWFVIEKLLWMAVFTIAVYASFKLTKSVIGVLVYSANTYVLLLFSGGQLGVALAYALAPLVFLKFTEKNLISSGFWFAVLVVFDLRIAFLMFWAIVFYGYRSIIPFLVAASVHMFWILPTILAPNSLPGEFTNPGMLKFLSFADFSHALSFLHPNWPENLFGKVYFLQPEFLIIPILAFGAVSKKTRYFAFLALIGVFLAKGVNPPFGGIFEWMFSHVPGFVMFRDPTKFYLYVALGYSILIPYTLKKLPRVCTILFIIFWLFTLRDIRIPVSIIPDEYVQLKNLLLSDAVPSRTLWIPQKEPYAFYSSAHPVLTSPHTDAIDPSVKYVIVPIDVNKKIFLDNYKFDPSLREKVISSISLPRNPQFQDLAVFENPSFSGMQSAVPAIVAKQQQFANIGLGISVAFLILWIFLR